MSNNEEAPSVREGSFTPETEEIIKSCARDFWSDPDNVKKFQKIEAKIRRDVDARLSRGNAALKQGHVTTVEDSIRRRIAVGLPVYEFE